MTYEELVALAKENYGTGDASNIKEHVAIQFNITGEAAGAFYLEIKDGQVDIQPYEYYDRDVIVTCEADTLLKIASGKLGMEAAYFSGKIKAEGDLGKALLLKELTKKEAKKATKKPCAKKTVKAVKNAEETKTEAVEEKKTPAKRTCRKK